MTTISIRHGAVDHTKAADTLAAAFHRDPFNVWLIPDEARRERRLATGMAQQVAIYTRRDGVWTTSDHAAVALWAPPDRHRLGALEQLRLLPGLGHVMGWRALPRVLRAFGQLDERHPEEAHWYLALVGVRPERQGRGLGREVLAPAHAACDRERIGAYLETSNEDNLAFYEALGYRVRDEFDLANSGPHIWTLWREPGPSAP